MYDALLALQALVTKTATFTGAALDLGAHGLGSRALVARLLITAASGTTPTLVGKLQESDDNSAWNDLITFESQAAVSESFRRFTTNKRYVRFVATIAGTTPSFAYAVDVGLVAS